MSNKFLILIVFIASACCGCVSAGDYEPVTKQRLSVVRQFVSVSQLQKALTRSEAEALLGSQVIIGYDMPDTRTKRYKPVIIQNPYRTEELDAYVIDYYFAGINKVDDKITDDELIPLIFRDEALIGWGWEFFKGLRIKE